MLNYIHIFSFDHGQMTDLFEGHEQHHKQRISDRQTLSKIMFFACPLFIY